MPVISKDVLQKLREQFTKGTRVELVHMSDPFNHLLIPGCKGTVIAVDDIGTIHVKWDCGSSLGVIYGEDVCRRVEGMQR